MQIQDITSALKDRGAVWQAVGFALLGTASTATLSIYSDSHHWIAETYRIGATQQQWAFVAIIALTIEGVRTVFEKATEIRRRYSAKADAKAEAKGRGLGRVLGRNEERERIKSELLKRGINLTEEDEQALFNPESREN